MMGRAIGAGAGVAAVVMMVAGNGLAGGQDVVPAVGASEAEVARVLETLDPGAGARGGAALGVLGVLMLTVFLLHVAALIGGTAGRFVLVGAATAGAVKLVSFTPVMALWLRPDEVDPALAGLVFDANAAAFTVTGAAYALATGGAAAAAITSSRLPRWTGWTALVVTIALLASLPLFVEQIAIGFLLFLIWLVALSVALVRQELRRGRGGVRARPAPTAA
jgi:hypothetical protein